MRPGSLGWPEQAAIIGQLRRQLHWMADDVLRSILGVGPEVSKPRSIPTAARGRLVSRKLGAGSAVGVHRRLKSALNRRIAVKQIPVRNGLPSKQQRPDL